MADVVVVGGGVMGVWAAIRAAQAGAKRVVLLEQFEPGHAWGSSHGDGRIVRPRRRPLSLSLSSIRLQLHNCMTERSYAHKTLAL